MNIQKLLGAALVSAVVAGAAIPASASGLMNVTTSTTSSLSANIKSHTTSWDEYAGVQLSISETSSTAGALGGNLTGLNLSNALGGNLNLYGQKSQNFSAQASLTFFKGGDTSDVRMDGHLNQMTTTFQTGVTTSFGN